MFLFVLLWLVLCERLVFVWVCIRCALRSSFGIVLVLIVWLVCVIAFLCGLCALCVSGSRRAYCLCAAWCLLVWCVVVVRVVCCSLVCVAQCGVGL